MNYRLMKAITLHEHYPSEAPGPKKRDPSRAVPRAAPGRPAPVAVGSLPSFLLLIFLFLSLISCFVAAKDELGEGMVMVAARSAMAAATATSQLILGVQEVVRFLAMASTNCSSRFTTGY